MLIALLDRNVVTFSDVKVGTYYFVFFCLGPISILKSALHSKKIQPNFPNMTKLKTRYFDGPKAGDWNKNIHSKIKSYFLAFVFLSEHTYSPRCYVTFDPLFFNYLPRYHGSNLWRGQLFNTVLAHVKWIFVSKIMLLNVVCFQNSLLLFLNVHNIDHCNYNFNVLTSEINQKMSTTTV